MLEIKIKNSEVEKYLKEQKNAERVIEDIVLDLIRKRAHMTAQNLKVFEELLERNKKLDLRINPDIDLSRLADEVHDGVF